MSSIIDKILIEWSKDVPNGMPNPSNPYHLVILEKSMDSMKIPKKVAVKILQNLREKDLVKNKESGTTYAVKKHNPDTQDLIKKDASAKDIKDVEKKKDDKKEPTKDKGLKQDIDFNNPPESIKKETEPSDEEFQAQENIKSHVYNPSEIEVGGQQVKLPLTEDTLKSIFKQSPHKFPNKYIKTLSRIMNTQKINKDNPAITSFTNSPVDREKVGAGQISAQASELLMLMSTSLSDAESDLLYDMLEKTVGATQGKNQILDKGWIQASKGMRNSAIKNIKEEFGDDATVEFAGWDSQADFEDGIGLPYGNKGFSTDTVFRVKTSDGKSHIAEVSNKKDLTIHLGSPSAAATEKGLEKAGIKIKDSQKASLYTKNAKNRSDEKFKNTKQDDLDILSNMDSMSDEKLLNYLSKLPDEMRAMFTTGNKAQGLTLAKDARKYLKLKDVPLPWDKSNSEFVTKFKEMGLGSAGDSSRVNKAAIFMAYLQYADELNKGVEDGPGMNFIHNQVGIIGKEPFPEGSQRDVQNNFIMNLDKPKAREVVMGTIKDKFPLKNLMDGEESMVLGNFRLSPKVCNNIFGTTDYDKIQEKLSVQKDKDGNYYLTYGADVEGGEKGIQIAHLKARGKGIGYSNITFEMSMAEQFKHTVYCGNMKTKTPPKKLTDAETKEVSKLKRKYGDCS